jgi:oligosaccharyltransferase complex subunit delta (ribophorin II)
MLQAADALANNQFVVPVGLVRTDSLPVTSSDSSIEFKLTNILNEGVGSSSVTMVMIQDPSGETTNTNVPLNANGDIYSLSLANNVGTPGNYKLTLSTDTQGNSQAADLSGVQFGVVVTQTVNIGSADLFIIEKEQNVAVKSLSLQYPNPVTEVLTADHHSKVKMTFTLTGSSTKATSVHQAFVRLSSEDGEEIFFVAMPTSQGEYVFELDVAKAAKESFGYKSGAYSMSLIVGGALVDNPFVWDVCKLTLKFPAGQQEGVDEEKLYRNKPRPVIEHMFRLPEKLPPFTVSAAFSVIIVFFLVVLLIMWLIMGANVTNLFSSGPWALVFHCGLISIFLLYYCFWIKMNMFQTLKWLALLGGITFLAGNKMLKNISKNK